MLETPAHSLWESKGQEYVRGGKWVKWRKESPQSDELIGKDHEANNDSHITGTSLEGDYHVDRTRRWS